MMVLEICKSRLFCNARRIIIRTCIFNGINGKRDDCLSRRYESSRNKSWSAKDKGVLTNNVGALTNDFFVNLTDMKYHVEANGQKLIRHH